MSKIIHGQVGGITDDEGRATGQFDTQSVSTGWRLRCHGHLQPAWSLPGGSIVRPSAVSADPTGQCLVVYPDGFGEAHRTHPAVLPFVNDLLLPLARRVHAPSPVGLQDDVLIHRPPLNHAPGLGGSKSRWCHN